MQELEPFEFRGRQLLPVGSRRLEHGEGADDVRLNESLAAGYGAVDVALGGEVDHMIRLKSPERLRDRATVADVDPGETVVRSIVDCRQGGEIARVGESVDIQNVDAGADQMPAHGGADEPRAAGHKHATRHWVSCVMGISCARHVASDRRRSGNSNPYRLRTFPCPDAPLRVF